MSEGITTGNSGTVTHQIAVMSGKGGVGKSVITGLLATTLQRQGYRVGILDADLACPSIAHLFHLEDEPPIYTAEGFEPSLSQSGVKVISINMAGDESDPLVWIGPMLSSALKQFYTDAMWGDLDYLFIDIPPGTADVPMTVLQSFSLDGVIIVSTPQLLATATVKKCINMVHQHQRKIFGVVENMVYFIDPTGEKCDLYGQDTRADLLALADAPLLAEVPIDPQLVALCDQGRIEEYSTTTCDTLAANFLTALEARR